MAIASWGVALTSQPGDGVSLGSIVTVVVALALAFGSVLLLPIDRPWLRWIVNPLILVVPILVTLELFVA